MNEQGRNRIYSILVSLLPYLEWLLIAFIGWRYFLSPKFRNEMRGSFSNESKPGYYFFIFSCIVGVVLSSLVFVVGIWSILLQ
jgi:hypothetical protein